MNPAPNSCDITAQFLDVDAPTSVLHLLQLDNKHEKNISYIVNDR